MLARQRWGSVNAELERVEAALLRAGERTARIAELVRLIEDAR